MNKKEQKINIFYFQLLQQTINLNLMIIVITIMDNILKMKLLNENEKKNNDE